LPVSRIFISHSSTDNAPAIALRDWLVSEGWDDLFLDLDPERGIAAGERWERRLNEAARRCEAVLFLISKAWLASRWCTNELNLARRLNKRLFGILIEEGLAVGDLPADVTSKWQLVNLATGSDHRQFPITLPVTGELATPTFSLEGLARLKSGLQRAGLAASWFAWPPELDPQRSPYRGLKPLEAEDAGIFFGREAPTIEAIDLLRGMCEAAPPRLLVILGASGAGKSSFLRAGLLPRLRREDRTFLLLPVIRPERSPITGDTGFLRVLEGAFAAAGLTTPRAELRAAIESGAGNLKPMLATLAEKATPMALEGEAGQQPPTIVIAIDQAEELFLAEAQDEAQPFLALLHDLVASDPPAVIAVCTIRSDNYERFQDADELVGVHQQTMSLPAMPRGSYAEVIKGPARRLDGTARGFKIDDFLVEVLLTDIDKGGAKDALPLLAFTLERLYDEYHATGQLKAEHYDNLGRISGSIAAAVDRAFKAADNDARIPRDREARLTLLRRGLIPWLAGIDPDTKAPRRRVARLSEIPAEARPLIDLLVEQRLLAIDVSKETGETTIEPAHEALLRQWGLLRGWLSDDAGLLTVLDGIKRAARDWAANGKDPSWLVHVGKRLRAAKPLLDRPDLIALLEPTERAYVAECYRANTVLPNWAIASALLLITALAASYFIADLFDRFYERPELLSYVERKHFDFDGWNFQKLIFDSFLSYPTAWFMPYLIVWLWRRDRYLTRYKWLRDGINGLLSFFCSGALMFVANSKIAKSYWSGVTHIAELFAVLFLFIGLYLAGRLAMRRSTKLSPQNEASRVPDYLDDYLDDDYSEIAFISGALSAMLAGYLTAIPLGMRIGFIIGPLAIATFTTWYRRSFVLTVSKTTFVKSATFTALIVMFANLIATQIAAKQLGYRDTTGELLETTFNLSEAKEANEPVAALLIALPHMLNLTPEARARIGQQTLKFYSQRISFPLSALFQRERTKVASSTESPAPSECDQLAAHPLDPFRVGAGVPYDKLQGKDALAKCAAALETFPGEARFLLERARAHSKLADEAKAAKEDDEARLHYAAEQEDLKAAIEKNYPIAVNNLGFVYERGRGVQKNEIKSNDLRLEFFNRVAQCCAAVAIRALLAEKDRHDATTVARVATALLAWAADLGNADADTMLSKEIRAGHLPAPAFPRGKATITDLPPWLR
jgi:hypothetical protein